MSSFMLSSLLNLLTRATMAAMVGAWAWLIVQCCTRRCVFGPPVVREVPWGFFGVAASVLAWFGLQIVVAFAYVGLTARPPTDSFTFTEQIFITTAVNALALVIVPLVLRALSRAKLADFGLGLSGCAKPLGTGAVAFLIVTGPVDLLNVLCVAVWPVHQKHPLEEMVRGGLDLRVAYLAVLSAVVLAPAVEELLFRGIVQGCFTSVFRRMVQSQAAETHLEWADEPSVEKPDAARGRAADWTAIVVTSALFGLAHAPQWPAPIPLFAFSLVLGVVYQRTGSVLASFVTHALFNGFSTLVLFWALSQGPAQPVKGGSPPPPVTAPAAGAAAPAKPAPPHP